MIIHQDNINFTGKWTIFNILRRKMIKSMPLIQSDTFTRTKPSADEFFNSIKKGDLLSRGREAAVYRTNNDKYVLRIESHGEYKPEDMIPVKDRNGLIVAVNSDNTVQLQKYVRGVPLYGKNWDIFYSNVTKDEYLNIFNKLRKLPNESFVEYIRNIINIRKSGYDIDTLNPNNVLFDGVHLNIVDIKKNNMVKSEICMTDFYALIDFFHIKDIKSSMTKEEIGKFTGDLQRFFDRIISVAKKEGYFLDKKSMLFYTEIYPTSL